MARAEAGFEMMEAYIQQSKNTVAQYIATRSLMDLCESTKRTPGGGWGWGGGNR